MSIMRCDKHGSWDSDKVESCPRCEMTARPEAPTLDEQIEAQQQLIRNVSGHEIAEPMSVAILASLERLRAAVQAAGMPEEPMAECPSNIDGTMYECEWNMGYVSTHDYDALHAHCLHLSKRLGIACKHLNDLQEGNLYLLGQLLELQSKLARMEALLRVIQDNLPYLENLILPSGHDSIVLRDHPQPCKGKDFCVVSQAQKGADRIREAMSAALLAKLEKA